MIVIDNLYKSYGPQGLFDGISFKVNARERVGVVGRNGHGKTTLFRIITGEEKPDSGSVMMPKNYRIGYMEQLLDFREATVLEEAAMALPTRATNETWRVKKVLAGLGFSRAELRKSPAELSGGFQVRLNLAKILLGDYQMLLLDEPTNFLDITSIRWLEKFLKSWPGEIMLITHDRSFMDGLATHILGIHRKKIRKIRGDTGKYYGQIASDEEIYEKTRLNDERKRREMDIFINRFRAKARLAGLVQSRIKTMERMQKRERLEEIKDLEFVFRLKPFHHKYAMDIKEVSFSYEPGRPIIDHFSLNIGGRDRVFVVGKNGRGKTTLMKLLAGDLEPDSGEISFPMSVVAGYFEQSHISSLNDDRTVLEEIAAADPGGDPKKARAIAAAMMFEGDDALKQIEVLSGGERSRVLLGKLIAAPVNLLLLDEPTNHLDLQSSDALMAALDNFDGAVIMVTHNEMFLHALAERLIVFEDDGMTVFEGGYQSFLEKVGWQEERENGLRVGRQEPAGKAKINPREMRRRRSKLIEARSKALRPLETRIGQVESVLKKKADELGTIDRQLVEASSLNDGQKVIEMSKDRHRTKKELDDLTEEIQRLSAEYEASRERFELELREFDKNLTGGETEEK